MHRLERLTFGEAREGGGSNELNAKLFERGTVGLDRDY